MPIPQFTHRRSNEPAWAKNKKKYFVGSNHKPEKGPNKHQSLLARLFALLLKNKRLVAGALMIMFIAGLTFIFLISRNLPDPNKLIERQIAQSTKIYDRTGKTVLYELAGEQKRTLVTLNDIPANVRNATVAIEDKDFYRHGGFSLWAIFRTVVMNVVKQQKAGGSTLTQQFVKNAILTNEKTYTRKVKELILAYRIEKKFSKDEILQMYLNEIPYGSTAYGVESASQRYFGKSVKDTNLAEAAILAALPQAPSRYSPYGTNRELLLSRQHYILDQMAKQGYVTQSEADAAKNTELAFKKQSDNILAPHFVMYIKDLVSEKYGDIAIEQEGLKIYTTLDLDKQKVAEEVLSEQAAKNLQKYDATNAALVSIDPKSGQVLAMVGSKDYFSQEIDGQVNITTRERQPGSSFKPIVYAASFIKGYTPDTILYDVVTNFSTDTANKYEPHNYDGAEHGPVTIRKALAGSLNIPAVKAIYLTGIDNVLDLANKLGYSSLKDKDRFGLSLVLGGGEVSLLEHTNAYATFAQDGKTHLVSTILKIEDKNGKVLEEYKGKEGKAFDPQIARQITSILSDNAARTYVFGSRNSLTLSDRPVAAKTGTTNDYKDAWTVGYTPSLVTGVWVGNNNNTSMKRGADGSVVAAPIWHNYMQKVLADTPVESFKQPEEIKTGKAVLDGNVSGEVKVKIDRASSLLATEFTPLSFIEEKTYVQHHSILYHIDKNDPRGEAPKDPSSDPQFKLWEEPVLAWAKKQGFEATSTPPTESDNLHKPENRPTFSIETPTNNQSIVEPVLRVNITASAPRGINRAEYYIDNTLLASVAAFPFNLERQIGFIKNGQHELTAKVCDDIDNCSEQKLDLNFSAATTDNPVDSTIAWLTPGNESSLSASNFPLTLSLSLGSPEVVTKINLYYTPASTTKPQLIATATANNQATPTISWTKPPKPGSYQLYAEAESWGGKTSKTETKLITIQ